MRWWVLVLMACGGTGSDPSASSEPDPSKQIAPAPTAKAMIDAEQATVEIEAGWGAVFWRNNQAWRVGGGAVLVSRSTAKKITASGTPLICDGVAVKGAPARAALALPEGAAIPTIKKAPAVQAHTLERAAWRLDEVLPPRGKYSPAVTSAEPGKQRGVEVGSVAKTRRHGAPPVLLATGVRDCSAAITVLGVKADRTLAYDRVPDICTPLRVIPATQLDQTDGREFAAFNDTDVLLYRLNERAGRVGMTRIGHWKCAPDSGGG